MSRHAVPAAGMGLLRRDHAAITQPLRSLRSASRPGAFQPSSLVKRIVVTRSYSHHEIPTQQT